LFRSSNHRPRSTDLGLPDSARRFDVHNDPELHIDQVVVGAGEVRLAFHCHRPLRRWI
jgi:hypothetical protein